MSVYVDNTTMTFRGWKASHLLADSVPELMAFAKKLGLKPEWLQKKPIPHFDIAQTKRKQALKLGAKELGKGELMRIYRTYVKVTR